VLHDPDVAAAMKQIVAEFAIYPDSSSAYDWAMLNGAQAPEAEKSAEILKHAPRFEIEGSIELLLNPCAVNSAMEWNWLMQAQGRPADGKPPLAKIAEMGLPIPVQP